MIKKRIIQLLEFKGIPKESFYKKIGMTSASFRGKASETPINSIAIENILSEIPDLNIYWLLTGQEPVLRSEPVPKMSEVELTYKELADSRLDVIDGLKFKLSTLEKELTEMKYMQKESFLYKNVAEPAPELTSKKYK
jgi:hypothetical protein